MDWSPQHLMVRFLLIELNSPLINLLMTNSQLAQLFKHTVQPAAGGSSLTTGTTWNWNPDLPNSMQQIPKFFKFSNYGNCAPR